MQYHFIYFIIVVFILVQNKKAFSDYLETVHQWNFLRFNLPTYFPILGKNRIKLENAVFTGLEITEDYLFLSIPRLRDGIPATLTYIPRYFSRKVNPVLKAYPSWSYHLYGMGYLNCSGLISVYRIRKDRCNRLWVLDSGVSDSLNNFRRVCQPKIMIFNLKSHNLEFVITVPNGVLKQFSLLTNFVIDETLSNFCQNIYLYISDTAEPGIIVYNENRNLFWRLEDDSMKPERNYSQYNIEGEQFSLMDGIIGLAHSVRLDLLYYQALASNKLYAVSTSFLRKIPQQFNEKLTVILIGEKISQGVGLDVDPFDDTVYFSPISETSLALWNPHTGDNRVITRNRKKLQFVTEIRVANDDSNNLWLLSSRFQKYFLNTTNFNETNYRIMRITSETYDLPYFKYSLNTL